MNRYRFVRYFSLILLCVLLFSANTPKAAAAAVNDKQINEKTTAGVIISGICYYAWWLKPIWGKMKFFPYYKQVFLFNNPVTQSSMNFTRDKDEGSFLYGPAISVRIRKGWSISGSFITGFFKSETDYYSTGTSSILPLKAYLRARKYDADLLVNYRVNRWLKFFFGPKYQGYYYIFSGWFPQIYKREDATSFRSGGLGVGLGTSIPLCKGLYIMANASGICLIGKETTARLYLFGQLGKEISVAAGINTTLSLSYHIVRIGTTISLGGRFQYLYYISKASPEIYQNNEDLFSGINLQVAVSF